MERADFQPLRTGDGRMVNAMSVDVEEHFQVGAFERCISRSDWAAHESRVVGNVERVLEMFDNHRVKGTFFTLGWVAERHPTLVRTIVDRGHELASHGYGHDRVSSFDAGAFRADLDRSRKLLEDVSGRAVLGYRAPSFSIGKGNAWALDVLAEEGYAYSSSVAPIRHDHYGWPDAPRAPHRPVAGSSLLEIPVTTVEVAGRKMASGGGGFFRILPYGFSSWAIRRVNEQDAMPAIFYFHPWEIDTEQPRVAGAPLRSRLRHYTNLGIMQQKLERLLKAFAWDRFDRVYAAGITAPQAA